MVPVVCVPATSEITQSDEMLGGHNTFLPRAEPVTELDHRRGDLVFLTQFSMLNSN